MRKHFLSVMTILCLLVVLVNQTVANPLAPRWHRINNDGPSRREHKCAYDTRRDAVVLFGGMDSISVYDSDVWEWSNHTWRRIQAPGPGARLGHGMCYDTLNHVTLMFGGRLESGEYANDFWAWDGTSWTQITAEGPSPRGFFTFAYDPHRHKVVLFGGCHMNTIFGETWEWDGSTWTLTYSDGPPPRILSAMAFDYSFNEIVLFGGRPAIEEGFLGDTWGLGDSGWVERICENPPSARAGHAMIQSSLFDDIMMTSGFDSDFGPLPYGTWFLSGSYWSSIGLFEEPEQRYFTDMIYKTSDGVALLIGGSNNSGTFGDIWQLPFYVNDFRLGDVNNNGVFDGLDVTYSINFFKGFGPPPPFSWDCLPYGDTLYAAGDVNNSCSFNGIDVTYSVNYFKGIGPGPLPCQYCPPMWW